MGDWTRQLQTSITATVREGITTLNNPNPIPISGIDRYNTLFMHAIFHVANGSIIDWLTWGKIAYDLSVGDVMLGSFSVFAQGSYATSATNFLPGDETITRIPVGSADTITLTASSGTAPSRGGYFTIDLYGTDQPFGFAHRSFLNFRDAVLWARSGQFGPTNSWDVPVPVTSAPVRFYVHDNSGNTGTQTVRIRDTIYGVQLARWDLSMGTQLGGDGGFYTFGNTLQPAFFSLDAESTAQSLDVEVLEVGNPFS